MPGLFTATSREEIDGYGALGFVLDSDGAMLCRRCAPVGEALRPVMTTRDWISGDQRYEELSCDSCYRNIDEYDNPDYCACGDGCYANECDNCGDNYDDGFEDEDGYFESSGCTCDSCVAASQYQPGSDPEPFTGDEPADSADPADDDEPVEVPPIDWDAVIPRRRQYRPSYTASSVYVDAGERMVYERATRGCLDLRSPEGWYCERERGHDGPHRCFDGPEHASTDYGREPLAWVANVPPSDMGAICGACGVRYGNHYGYMPSIECPMPDGSRAEDPSTWWTPAG